MSLPGRSLHPNFLVEPSIRPWWRRNRREGNARDRYR